MNKNRYMVISCEILFREVCLCAAKCRNIVDLKFIEKGLHDIGAAKMSEELQNEIDQVDPARYDAILLCYGLCNNGIVGLHSPLPIVIPRAHDCITLMMGSKEKYRQYFNANPGTYFKSSGWLERDADPCAAEGSTISQLGIGKPYDEYVELYGEENAEFLASVLGDMTAHYRKAAYINDGAGNIDSDRTATREFAESKGWEYEETEGGTGLIRKLFDGDWDEREFLVVLPDKRITPSNDDGVIKYE